MAVAALGEALRSSASCGWGVFEKVWPLLVCSQASPADAAIGVRPGLDAGDCQVRLGRRKALARLLAGGGKRQ